MLILGLGFFSLQGDAHADALDARKKSDASAHKGVIVPTAETLDKGEISFTSFELLFFDLSYGITETTQASFTSVVPLFPDMPFGGIFALKQKVVKTPRFQLSVMPNLTTFVGADGGLVGLQIMADYALDPAGKYIVSISDNNQFVFGDGELLTEGLFINTSVGFSAKLRPNLAFLLELNVPAVATNTDESADFSASDIFLASYGFRYMTGSLSGDFAFLRLLGDGMNLTPLGFPYVAVTANF